MLFPISAGVLTLFLASEPVAFRLEAVSRLDAHEEGDATAVKREFEQAGVACGEVQ